MLEQIWNDRFLVLKKRISKLKENLENAEPFPRQQPLLTLAQNLEQFAEKHFKKFYEGFNDGKLQTSDLYPPEHVLIVILEQIGFDLDALQWAVDQRRVQDNPETINALAIADKIGLQALQPAIDGFELGNLTIIAYFQKFAEIRMIPYAQVALLGIPYTCIPEPLNEDYLPVRRDYLAIPHQARHYVYWHSKNDKKPLRYHLAERFSGNNKPSWGMEWLEEIFADVYGCLIAGPVIARSFQDLQLRHSQKRFVEDDGEHPVPILRPDIYTKVLRKHFNNDKADWAVEMNTKWVEKRNKRDQKFDGITPDRKFYYRENNQFIARHITDAISPVDSNDDRLIDPKDDKPIDIMVNTILDILKPRLKPVGWWHDYFAGKAISDTYQLFSAQFKEGFETLEAPGEQFKSLSPADLHALWLAESQPNTLRVNNGEDEPPVWLPLFRAGGWATRGPDDNPTSG